MSGSHQHRSSAQKRRMHPLENLMDLMTKHADEFRKYAMEDDSELGFFLYMPCNLSQSLDAFEKLLLIKLLRPDKIIFGI